MLSKLGQMLCFLQLRNWDGKFFHSILKAMQFPSSTDFQCKKKCVEERLQQEERNARKMIQPTIQKLFTMI